MKLFVVLPDRTDWDQYAGFVVRASSHREAKDIAMGAISGYDKHDQTWRASEIKVEGKPEVILDSFKAG